MGAQNTSFLLTFSTLLYFKNFFNANVIPKTAVRLILRSGRADPGEVYRIFTL